MSMQTRRHFLATLSSAGAAGLISPLQSFAQEGPPQTTTIRLAKIEGEAAMRAYESSDILQKTILPQLKPSSRAITRQRAARSAASVRAT